MDLSEIRNEIDLIDSELVALIEKRMALVALVSDFKKSAQLPVLDEVREQNILAKVKQEIKTVDYQKEILASFQDIMKHSRSYQKQHQQPELFTSKNTPRKIASFSPLQK